IPSTPAVGTLMWVAGVLLAAGSLALVVLLLWLANSRLRTFETAIPNS
ncbi:MAG: hypothetical protein QOI23_2174, partial [Chloroflexota bacterium]|nr:hypothetical protein [Chloroflexota bacterium]